MTARYQRRLPGGAIGNGLDDGWHRPPGATYQAPSDGHATDYAKRGVSLRCRYWVTWVTIGVHRTGLPCNFDRLEDAQAAIQAHPETMSGGIYDRRHNKWVDD